MRWGKDTEPLEVRGPPGPYPLPPLQEPGHPCQDERRLQQAKDRPTPPSAVHLLPRYSPRAPRGQGTEARTPNLVWGHHTPDRRDLGQASYSTKEIGGTEPGEPHPPPLHHPAWLTAGPPLLASQVTKAPKRAPWVCLLRARPSGLSLGAGSLLTSAAAGRDLGERAVTAVALASEGAGAAGALPAVGRAGARGGAHRVAVTRQAGVTAPGAVVELLVENGSGPGVRGQPLLGEGEEPRRRVQRTMLAGQKEAGPQGELKGGGQMSRTKDG